MIPVELTLKNFMSYGERPEVLSFQEFHIACLSGDNGNGKSALLDAITWAIWGRTRVSGYAVTSDEALIRTGAEEMAVRLEFEVDHARYRIIKRLKRGGTSRKPSLTVALSTLQADGTWKKLGALQGSFQKRIDRIVGISFEVFVQSAYLLQGRWDMLSRNSPAKRRALLSEALGLDVYEKLSAAAADEARRCRKDIAKLDALLRKVDTNSVALPRIAAAKQAAELAVMEAARAHAVCEERLARLHAEAVSSSQVLLHRLSLIEQLHTSSDQYKELTRELTEREDELRQTQDVVNAREAVERDYFLLQQLVVQRDTLTPALADQARCENELNEVRGRLQQEEDKLLAEIRLAEVDVEAYKKEAARIVEIDARIAHLTMELRPAEERAGELGLLKSQFDQVEQQFEQERGRHDILKKQLADYEALMAAVMRQHRCSECETSLDTSQLQLLVERQNRQRAEMAAELEKLRTRGARLSQEKRSLASGVTMAAQAAEEASRIRGALEERQREREDLRTQAAPYDASMARLTNLKARHKSGDFGPALRIKVRQLEGEHQRLCILAAQLQDVQGQITQLEPARDRYQRFSQAAKQIVELSAEVQRKRTQLQELGNRISAFESELANLGVPDNSADVSLAVEQCQREVDAAQMELQDRQKRLAALELEFMSVEQAAMEAARLKQEIAASSEQLALNTTLTEVFGPEGIPHTILSDLIPRLQHLTNSLLAALSAGKLSIELLLEKAARTSIREGAVLEILVNDGAGCRPYELFSGGEAFRVNFALRLALSKLLASVAGVPLHTIFIDEGFGSQDGSGRQRVVEMLRAIENQFAKVVVITHVDEIKESFATRIEITRDEDGSHVALLKSRGVPG